MNARIPASSTGPWGQVKHHQVLAAFVAAMLVTAVVGAALAWSNTDGSGGSSKPAGVSTSTFDYIEYSTFVAPDLNAGAEEIEALKGRSRATTAPDLNAGAEEIDGLKDARLLSPVGDGVVDLYAGLTEAEAVALAIAEHSAAFPEIIVPNGVTNDSVQPSASEAHYPASRDGMRGPVTLD